jgi:hypothetical protein
LNQPDDDTTVLFRPVVAEELRLIEQSGFRAFPPRSAQQPIFYPVLTEEFALKIVHEWLIPDWGAGYVTRFKVHRAFLSRYQIENAGGPALQEYWIPAEDLIEFNRNIVGLIEVIRHFRASS